MPLALSIGLFAIPGLCLLCVRGLVPTKYAAEKIPAMIALSLAYWIIGFWWLSLVPIPFFLFVSISLTVGTGFLAIYFVRKKLWRHLPSVTMTDLAIISWYGVLFIPFGILARGIISPPGQDMSMHAYLAESIRLADGFPSTLRPLLPIDSFGAYPFGFSVIIAGLSLLTHIRIVTSSVIITAVTYWLVPLSLFALLRTRYSLFMSALVATFISWVPIRPIDIIEWGANPTVLSFDILCIALSVAAISQHRLRTTAALCLVGTAFLITYIVPVAMGYIAVGIALVYLVSSRAALRPTLRPWDIVRTAVVFLPYLLRFPYTPITVAPETMRFVAGLQHAELPRWDGSLLRMIPELIWYAGKTLGNIPLIYFALSITMLLVKKWRYGFSLLGISFGVLLLIANEKWWILPFSQLLYPDRIILLLLIPMGFGIAEGLTFTMWWVYRYVFQHSRWRYALLMAAVTAIISLTVWDTVVIQYRRLQSSSRFSVMTEDDMIAMDWIKRHTLPTDVFLNNYSDAGIWIPAASDRQVTTYHTNPFDMETLRTSVGQPTYAYAGGKSLTDNQEMNLVNATVANYPDRFALVFSSGNVRVYRIVSPLPMPLP